MTLAGSSPSSEGDLVSWPWDKIVAVEQFEETLVSGSEVQSARRLNSS